MNRHMLAVQIAADLREQIRAGKLPVGAPVLSARQLAESYQVSIQTANKAVLSLMKEKLLRRVQGSGTFVIEHEDTVRRKRFGSGFLMPHFDPNSVRVAFAAWRDHANCYLQQMGHQVAPVLFEDLLDEEKREQILQPLDGLIIPFGVASDPQILCYFAAREIPVTVIMHDRAFSFPFHQVVPDIFCAFLRLTQQLLRDGRDKLVIASYGQRHVTMIGREEELRRAALLAGFREENITGVYGDLLVGDTGRLCGRDLYPQLPLGRDDTTVVSLSDFISFGIVDELRKHEREVGRELALVSYDDLEGEGLLPFGTPQLSCLSIPRQRIAERAAELLINRSEYRGQPESLTVSVPVSLVFRQSYQPKQ